MTFSFHHQRAIEDFLELPRSEREKISSFTTKNANQLCERMLKSFRLRENFSEKLMNHWPDLVGANLAFFCFLEQLTPRKCVIGTSSAAVRKSLLWKLETITEQVNKLLKLRSPLVVSIRLVIGK